MIVTSKRDFPNLGGEINSIGLAAHVIAYGLSRCGELVISCKIMFSTYWLIHWMLRLRGGSCVQLMVVEMGAIRGGCCETHLMGPSLKDRWT